jgi:DNA modification methylase
MSTPDDIAAVLEKRVPWALIEGDCLDVLRAMPDASVDAMITDPPAGIAFMGKEWDDPKAWEQPVSAHGFTDGGDRVPAPTIGSARNPMCRTCHRHKRGWKDHPGCECVTPDYDDDHHRFQVRDYFVGWLTSIMQEALRVLKPGGHGLVWAIPRTSHWTGTALEEAGFEVRNRIAHLFGSGFPKSLDVSKAIDKAAGAERGRNPDHRNGPNTNPLSKGDKYSGGYDNVPAPDAGPVTPEAVQWAGWGTALKPAMEDWWLVRKPVFGTVASNVLAHGTGALNIAGCRVAHANADDLAASQAKNPGRSDLTASDVYGAHLPQQRVNTDGRWPANLVLSHTPECRCVGTKRVDGNGHWPQARGEGGLGTAGHTGQDGLDERHAADEVEVWECSPDCAVRLLDEQSGTVKSAGDYPSTFNNSDGGFSGVDKGNGLGAGVQGPLYSDTGGASRFFYTAKAAKSERNLGGVTNKHPTVKPLDLMVWLCKLITPPGGIVLDPFAGSGSTIIAALRQGFRGIGIEREPEYVAIARHRIEEDAPLMRRPRPTLTQAVPETTAVAPEPQQLSLLGVNPKEST